MFLAAGRRPPHLPPPTRAAFARRVLEARLRELPLAASASFSAAGPGRASCSASWSARAGRRSTCTSCRAQAGKGKRGTRESAHAQSRAPAAPGAPRPIRQRRCPCGARVWPRASRGRMCALSAAPCRVPRLVSSANTAVVACPCPRQPQAPLSSEKLRARVACPIVAQSKRSRVPFAWRRCPSRRDPISRAAAGTARPGRCPPSNAGRRVRLPSAPQACGRPCGVPRVWEAAVVEAVPIATPG